MKKHTIKKSSITLPPNELAIVKELLIKLNASSKVDVIRRALKMLKQATDARLLQEEFTTASLMLRESNREDMEELDDLSLDCIEDD